MKRYTQYMYSYPHKTAYGPLEHGSLKDYSSCLSGPGHSLYLHVPFCQSKCGYCNLFSVTGQGEDGMERYLDAVERQIIQYNEVLSPVHGSFSDFTIGGGTPLLLSERQLDRMFSMVRGRLRLDRQAAVVIETAPNQTTAEKLRLLKDAGVFRVSMGIQSFVDEELRTLKRNHTAKTALEALSLLMEFEFSCVNVDFIYGIPGQTVRSLLDSLETVMKFRPQELFLYPLYVKHGVILEREQKQALVLNQELAYAQYLEAAGFLKAMGYVQDSMRRFVQRNNTEIVKVSSSRGGHYSARTDSSPSCIPAGTALPLSRPFADCGFGSSLSLGCGGRSYLGRLHCCTPYTVKQNGCLKQLEAYENTEDYTIIRHGYLLSEDELRRRYVIRHLLILPGLDKDRYAWHFGTRADKDFPILKKWEEMGYVEDRDGFLALTAEGMGLSDWLGPQLISPEVESRMKQWEADHGKNHDSLPGPSKKL